jgi:hypothetical protein
MYQSPCTNQRYQLFDAVFDSAPDAGFVFMLSFIVSYY